MPLLRHRLLLFTGKGGVGKTTVVASLAVHAAALGMRPLVVELGHRESMRSVFGVDDIGFQPKDVGFGVHAMSMDIDQAVLDYLAQHTPSRRVAKAIATNKVLERLFKAMPAVGEIVTLNKIRALEAQMEDGVPRWSPILVDLDATGHALMLLELRNVLENIVGAGPMLRLIDSTSGMLADPHQSCLSLVTTPDELPVTETMELYQRLRIAGTVAFGRVYINRVPARTLPSDVGPAIEQLWGAATAVKEDEVLHDVAFARQAVAARERAQSQIERLVARVDLPMVELPVLHAGRLSGDDLARLGALCAGEPREVQS